MPIQSISAKTIGAIWFGLLAAVVAVPFCMALFFSMTEWNLKFAVCNVFLEGITPIAVAAFWGSSMGAELCRKEAELRWQRACLVGAKIALASATTWVAITLLFTFILGLLTDATRIGGVPVLLAIVSLPITTLLAGVGAAILRMIVVKQRISLRENREGI